MPTGNFILGEKGAGKDSETLSVGVGFGRAPRESPARAGAGRAWLYWAETPASSSLRDCGGGRTTAELSDLHKDGETGL